VGRRGYPPEFRRKVLDLVASGRKVSEVAFDLEISEQTIYSWLRQDRIDRGLEPGLTTPERVELRAAQRRIAELEAELAIQRRAMSMSCDITAAEGVGIEPTTRGDVLKASADGNLGGSEPAVGGSWPALVTLFLVACFPACVSRCNR
jgi:transposase